MAFDHATTVNFRSALFEDEVADTNVTAIPSIADDYDFAANSYTKVSGLHYTGEGDQASDTLTIVVKDEFNNTLASDRSVSITVTGVNDPATFSGDDTGSVVEDGQTLTVTGDLDVSDSDSADTFNPQTGTAVDHGTLVRHLITLGMKVVRTRAITAFKTQAGN